MTPPTHRTARHALAAAALLCLAAPALAASGRYVNMGSSYASGPGVGERAPGSVASCAQSAENYAHVLADWRGLDLVDVSCSGATTHDILSPNGRIPAQVDAVTATTELVTVLIGGNDVGYVSTLLGLSCRDEAAAAGTPATCSVPTAASVDAALAKLPDSLAQVFAAVRARAPQARIVLVEYVGVVPRAGSCPDRAPFTPADQARAFDTHARLTAAMAGAARANGVGVLPAAALAAGHDICSRFPWVFGDHPPAGADPGFGRAPYHPNGAAHAVVAIALDRMLFPQ